jgi:uncharacterized protein YbgA (DUF1722 family)/uncharacterized protein YbbK (DUF523 family)
MQAPPSMKIGISSCLLGNKVRFDAGHKRNSYIMGVLNNYFEFVPFCPELEIGLGVPRETIRLVTASEAVRCVGTKTPSLDVTDALQDTAELQRDWQNGLCGYLFKKDSPSCGMERVKVYNGSVPSRTGVGIYARRVMQNFPFLPVEEEGRLEDERLRENFIRRVYVYARWRVMCHEGLTVSALQRFHAQHKYIYLSHDQHRAKALGALLADCVQANIEQVAVSYLEAMTATMRVLSSTQNHVNTLQHIQGYLKRALSADDKLALKDVIESYRLGLVPLIVPITLLRYFFGKYPNDYITQSYYLNPYPGELKLLNSL